jgi:hypothetical protein
LKEGRCASIDSLGTLDGGHWASTSSDEKSNKSSTHIRASV